MPSFSILQLCFETWVGYIFFGIQKQLRAIVQLFFSNFFQSFFSDGKFISFQLYLFIKCLIFVILCRSFLFLHDLTQLLQHIEYFLYIELVFYGWDLFELICFLSYHKNLYMIHHDLDFFHDIYNTINELNRTQTHYLSSILNHFNIYF